MLGKEIASISLKILSPADSNKDEPRMLPITLNVFIIVNFKLQ
jgi:hypothetical protein